MRIIYTYIVSILLFSCSQFKEQDKNIVYPKESIKELLNSFILENKHKNNKYEIYINKVYPDYYNIILYAGKNFLTTNNIKYENKASTIYTEIDGNKIPIYTGTEYFFRATKKKKKVNTTIKCSDEGVYWAIRDSSGILSIKKNIADPSKYFYLDNIKPSLTK